MDQDWDKAREEISLQAKTAPWWTPETSFLSVPIMQGVLYFAEMEDGKQRPLGIAGHLPGHILAMVRQGHSLIV